MTSKLSLAFSAALVIALLGYLYADSLVFLSGYWIGSEDYSHGMFVPLISLFLIWQARHRIAEARCWEFVVGSCCDCQRDSFSIGSVSWPRCMCCSMFRFGWSLWGWSLRRSESVGQGPSRFLFPIC